MLRNKTVFLLAIAIVLIIVIFTITIFSFFNKPGTTQPQNRILSSPTPFQEKGTTSQTKKITPLQKTEIGKTTDSEIVKSHKVLSKTTIDGVTIYTIRSLGLRGTDEIRTKNGIVIFEDTSTTTSTAPLPVISELEKQYGQPEDKMDKVGDGFYISAYLYPSKGFALYGNRYTDSVFAVQRFVPMTLDEYKKTYAKYLSPAPEMPREGTDIHE